MKCKKLISKNDPEDELNILQQCHDSLADDVFVQNKNTSQLDYATAYTQRTLSAWYVFVLLLVTAIALIIIYYKSVLIYWQQTYHFDLVNSQSLVQEIDPEELKPEQELLGQELREQELRQQELREQELREQELREQELRQQELREQELREQELREQELREQELREKELREKELQQQAAHRREKSEQMIQNGISEKSNIQGVNQSDGNLSVIQQPDVDIGTAKSSKIDLSSLNKSQSNAKLGNTPLQAVKVEEVNQPKDESLSGSSLENQNPNKLDPLEQFFTLDEIKQLDSPKVPVTHLHTSALNNEPLPIVLTENDKVFFAGDSLMQGVAPYVKKMLFKEYKIESINLSKQSTGLSYPKAFDWPETIKNNLANDPSIKLLVVFLGANDSWDFPVKGYSKYAKFKSELWEEQYRLRIASILNSAREHDVQVLWLAAPCMSKSKLNDGMVYLNTLYISELKKAQQHFLTTNNLLGCTYTNYNSFIESENKKIKVRTDDGIHFTPTGQKILAKAIMDKITFKLLEDNHSD